MARIIVESGPLRGKVLPVDGEGELGVGRDTGCWAHLPDSRASRVHFVLIRDGKHCILEDRQSRNGTFVNGQRVTKSVLRSGDMIRAGDTFLSFLDGKDDPLIGKSLAGYRLEQRLGRGGMGTVYRAVQVSLNRTVALKILSQSLTEDEEFIGRFIEEARAAGKLNHPNVVQVHDAGSHQDLYYLSMEFMPGGSLDELLAREGALAPRRVIPMMLDAARALVWAEGQGIVHRDIKPDNLMLDTKGTIKICDFGIAADRRRSKTLYEGGKVMGTPLYMAPEQALGKSVDQRADIYALGATFYYALSGKHAFAGDTPVELLMKKIHSDPTPLSDAAPGVPEPVTRLIGRMMARDPEARLATAREAYLALAALPRGPKSGGGARTRGTAARTPRANPAPASRAEGAGESAGLARGRPPRWAVHGALALAALLAVLGGVFLAGGFGRFSPSGDERDRPGAGFGPLVSGSETPGEAGEAAAGPPPGEPPLPVETPEPPLPLEPPAPPASAGEGEAPPSATEPPAPSPDAAATAAARRDLERLRDDWVSRRLKSQLEARARLDDFRKRHPEGTWDLPVKNVLETIREDGRKEVEERLESLVRPAAAGGQLAEASALLEELARTHPLNAKSLEPEALRVAEAAAAVLAAASERALAAAARGEFAPAREELAALRSRLPASFHARLDEHEAELERLEVAARATRGKLEEAERAVAAALRSLDFAAARAALAALPRASSTPGAPALGGERLEREVSLAEGAWRRIEARLAALAESREHTPLRLREEASPAGSAAADSRRVVAVSGTRVTLQRRGGASEEHPIAALADESLVALEAAGGAPETGEAGASAAADVEALGLLLLHLEGPGRAWSLLLDPRVPEAARSEYRTRLSPILAQRLEEGLVASLARIGAPGVPGAPGTPGTPGAPGGPEPSAADAALWEKEAEFLGGLALDARLPGTVDPLRADIAATFIECYRRALAARGPEALVSGKLDARPRGAVRLTYDFKDESQLRDFLPAGKGSEVSLERKGTGLFKGSVRHLRGQPFQGRLTVSGLVARYRETAPNINIAVWTRESDEMPDRNTWFDRVSAIPTGDVVIFAAGLHADSAGTINSIPYLTLADGKEVLLPANVLLLGKRHPTQLQALSGNFIPLSGSKPTRGYRGPLRFEIAVGPEGQMSWQMNSQSFIPRDVTPDLLDPRTSRGSWTLFTLGQTVALSGLIVEGALDSQWVEDETTRRAVDALRAIDPDYPFPNLSTPTESSRRPERAAGGAGKRLFLDGFQGNRDPAWTIESEERETYSFSTRPGTLTIETQSGTFAGSSTGYKNVFLIPSPATEGQDFEVTTRLLDFHPSAAYHQAGIIAIDDPDNYVMASIQFGGETRVQTRRLALGEETRGEVRSSISGIDQALSTFWLRMEKRGNAYRVLISLDGEVWEPRLHTFWGDGRPKRLGLFAMDASRNAPRIGASFDFFEVRALPSAVAE